MDIEPTNFNPPDQNSHVQKRNIIEEMNALNQRMQNTSNEIYKISSSWDKHSDAPNNKNVEIMMKEMMNYMIKMSDALTKMEASFTKMETAFENNSAENKREAKSFWDNFHF